MIPQENFKKVFQKLMLSISRKNMLS